MAEISLWGVIKACIIILLLLFVIKKILDIWTEHKRNQKYLDDSGYRNDIQQQEMARLNLYKDTATDLTNAVSNGVSNAVSENGNYSNPNPMSGGYYGGADDGESEEDVEDFEEDEEDSEDSEEAEEAVMEGGSFFDILSKIKTKPKKKSIFNLKPKKKAASKSKTKTKTKAKPKAKKTSTKKKGKK